MEKGRESRRVRFWPGDVASPRELVGEPRADEDDSGESREGLRPALKDSTSSGEGAAGGRLDDLLGVSEKLSAMWERGDRRAAVDTDMDQSTEASASSTGLLPQIQSMAERLRKTSAEFDLKQEESGRASDSSGSATEASGATMSATDIFKKESSAFVTDVKRQIQSIKYGKGGAKEKESQERTSEEEEEQEKGTKAKSSTSQRDFRDVHVALSDIFAGTSLLAHVPGVGVEPRKDQPPLPHPHPHLNCEGQLTIGQTFELLGLAKRDEGPSADIERVGDKNVRHHDKSLISITNADEMIAHAELRYDSSLSRIPKLRALKQIILSRSKQFERDRCSVKERLREVKDELRHIQNRVPYGKSDQNQGNRTSKEFRDGKTMFLSGPATKEQSKNRYAHLHAPPKILGKKKVLSPWDGSDFHLKMLASLENKLRMKGALNVLHSRCVVGGIRSRLVMNMAMEEARDGMISFIRQLEKEVHQTHLKLRTADTFNDRISIRRASGAYKHWADRASRATRLNQRLVTGLSARYRLLLDATISHWKLMLVLAAQRRSQIHLSLMYYAMKRRLVILHGWKTYVDHVQQIKRSVAGVSIRNTSAPPSFESIRETLLKKIQSQLEESIKARQCVQEYRIRLRFIATPEDTEWVRKGGSRVAEEFRVPSITDKIWNRVTSNPSARNQIMDILAQKRSVPPSSLPVVHPNSFIAPEKKQESDDDLEKDTRESDDEYMYATEKVVNVWNEASIRKSFDQFDSESDTASPSQDLNERLHINVTSIAMEQSADKEIDDTTSQVTPISPSIEESEPKRSTGAKSSLPFLSHEPKTKKDSPSSVIKTENTEIDHNRLNENVEESSLLSRYWTAFANESIVTSEDAHSSSLLSASMQSKASDRPDAVSDERKTGVDKRSSLEVERGSEESDITDLLVSVDIEKLCTGSGSIAEVVRPLVSAATREWKLRKTPSGSLMSMSTLYRQLKGAAGEAVRLRGRKTARRPRKPLFDVISEETSYTANVSLDTLLLKYSSRARLSRFFERWRGLGVLYAINSVVAIQMVAAVRCALRYLLFWRGIVIYRTTCAAAACELLRMRRGMLGWLKVMQKQAWRLETSIQCMAMLKRRRRRSSLLAWRRATRNHLVAQSFVIGLFLRRWHRVFQSWRQIENDNRIMRRAVKIFRSNALRKVHFDIWKRELGKVLLLKRVFSRAIEAWEDAYAYGGSPLHAMEFAALWDSFKNWEHYAMVRIAKRHQKKMDLAAYSFWRARLLCRAFATFQVALVERRRLRAEHEKYFRLLRRALRRWSTLATMETAIILPDGSEPHDAATAVSHARWSLKQAGYANEFTYRRTTLKRRVLRRWNDLCFTNRIRVRLYFGERLTRVSLEKWRKQIKGLRCRLREFRHHWRKAAPSKRVMKIWHAIILARRREVMNNIRALRFAATQVSKRYIRQWKKHAAEIAQVRKEERQERRRQAEFDRNTTKRRCLLYWLEYATRDDRRRRREEKIEEERRMQYMIHLAELAYQEQLELEQTGSKNEEKKVEVTREKVEKESVPVGVQVQGLVDMANVEVQVEPHVKEGGNDATSSLLKSTPPSFARVEDSRLDSEASVLGIASYPVTTTQLASVSSEQQLVKQDSIATTTTEEDVSSVSRKQLGTYVSAIAQKRSQSKQQILVIMIQNRQKMARALAAWRLYTKYWTHQRISEALASNTKRAIVEADTFDGHTIRNIVDTMRGYTPEPEKLSAPAITSAARTALRIQENPPFLRRRRPVSDPTTSNTARCTPRVGWKQAVYELPESAGVSSGVVATLNEIRRTTFL